jgi:hypothetical protein
MVVCWRETSLQLIHVKAIKPVPKTAGVCNSTRTFGDINNLQNVSDGVVNPVTLRDQLMFAVREPFQSKKTQVGLVTGIITGQTKLVLELLMPTNGVIFSDGIETDQTSLILTLGPL